MRQGRHRDWSAEWTYGLSPAEAQRRNASWDRGQWHGRANSEREAISALTRYVEALCGPGGRLSVANMRRIA